MSFSRRHILWAVSALFAIGLLLCFSLGAQRWEQYKGYRQAKARMQEALAAPQVIAQQKAMLKQLQAQAEHLQASSVRLEDQVAYTSYLELICQEYGVKMLSLPQETVSQVENYTISTEAFSLQGSLNGLLKVLYRLEHTDRVGSITRTNFQKKTRRRAGKKETVLVVDIHLKRLITS